MKSIDDGLKEKCVSLRREGRKSLKEISDATGVSRATLSSLLRQYPLSLEERKRRLTGRKIPSRKKSRGEESEFHKVAIRRNIETKEKFKIAEAAVLFRLCLHGFTVYGSPFDGDKVDWVVESPRGNLVKLQVKCVKTVSTGLPFIVMTCSDGRGKFRRYSLGEFDFIVGYDLYTDRAYVFSWDEAKDRKTAISITPESMERWDKMA